jgi:putative membrane protein
MMFDHYNGWDWGDWFAMSLMMLLVWGAIAAAVVWAMRAVRTSEPRQPGPGPDSAEQVLAERYARGEIDEDEYRRRSEVLKAPGRFTRS